MIDRKAIKRTYKEQPKTAGVFVLRNDRNGKMLLGSSLNLHGPWNSLRFQLKTETHWSQALQQDWNRYGEPAFTFEVLETLDQEDDPTYDYSPDLTLLEESWFEKLQPIGEKGYNTKRRIRVP